MNKPIFIVGSDRSGTTILTWCVGQHPNILAQEESNWIGRFAINVGVAYEIGTARAERSQLSALCVRREDFFALFGKSGHFVARILRTKLCFQRVRGVPLRRGDFHLST